MIKHVIFWIFFAFSLVANAQEKATPLHHEMAFYQSGYASRYGERHVGKKTALGDRYNPKLFTAASNTLPLGSVVKVEVARTKRSVWVKINDRGPHSKKRILDLSDRAAKKLGIYRQGVAKVNIFLVKT